MGIQILSDQGYSPIEILRYYYGDDMYINTAEAISGIPSSWPGYTLEIGSSGNKVLQMQEQLNVIAGAYPAIPKITMTGFTDLQLQNQSVHSRKYSGCHRPEQSIILHGIKFPKFT